MLEHSQKKLFLDATPMAIACICPTKNGELLIGLGKSEEQHFAVGRFSFTGECKQYITPMFNKWTPELIFDNYMDENFNWEHLSIHGSGTRFSRKRRA